MNAATKSESQKRMTSGSKRNLVFGLGKTGLSVARFLARTKRPACFLDTREQPPGLDELRKILPDSQVILGMMPDDLLNQSSLVIVSPGVADTNPFLEKARDRGINVVSDIDVFVKEVHAPFIVVTGTNGKSTVTTLLSLMCEAAGKTGLAGANLGVPALDLLGQSTPDYYILELSSFHLQRVRRLPASVAVLLNVSSDHLDWHADNEEYRSAKYRVFREAKAAVINRADEEVCKHLPDGAEVLSFGLDEPGDGEYGLRQEKDEVFLARGNQLLLSTSDIALVGRHNQENALAALAAGQLMGLKMSPMLQVLSEFPGLPHRMQLVVNINEIEFINDSKATNVGAAIAAVNSLDGPIVLIAGGQGKGGDFDRLATSTAGRLKAAVLIGEDANELGDAFEGLTQIMYAGDLKSAVAKAADIADSGDKVLLAPACASFDQYADYMVRGEDFCRAVQALKQ